MSDHMLWRGVEAVDRWLDESNPDLPANEVLRVAKAAEEIGEAISAYIGVTGQNPRKGVTHIVDDVLMELADTALAALEAIQHFTKDVDRTRRIVLDRIDYVHRRAGLGVLIDDE